MTKNAFKERERALEDQFFHRVDEKLLVSLRASLALEAQRQRLVEATRFDDETLLNELVRLGISAQALSAVSLVPLVLAWADGKVDDKERLSILRAAQEQGIAEEGHAAKILEDWMENEPGPQLASMWRHFVRASARRLSDESKNAMRSAVLRQTEAVARLSGGHLGLGSVSPEEKRSPADSNECARQFECAKSHSE